MRRFFLFSFWHYKEIRFEFDNFDNFDKCVRHFHFFSNNKILLNFLVAVIVKVVKVSKCQSVKVSKCQTACSTLKKLNGF